MCEIKTIYMKLIETLYKKVFYIFNRDVSGVENIRNIYVLIICICR